MLFFSKSRTYHFPAHEKLLSKEPRGELLGGHHHLMLLWLLSSCFTTSLRKNSWKDQQQKFHFEPQWLARMSGYVFKRCTFLSTGRILKRLLGNAILFISKQELLLVCDLLARKLCPSMQIFGSHLTKWSTTFLLRAPFEMRKVLQ